MSASSTTTHLSYWRTVRRWLYFCHRWIGVGTCLLFVIWFISGIVMIYVPFPGLTAEERVQGLMPIDWQQVRVDPNAALLSVDAAEYPRELRLEMLGDAPVYRVVDWQLSSRTVSAVDGKELKSFDAAAAHNIAHRFAGNEVVGSIDTIERDQWSVAGNYDKHRPLLMAVIADAKRTHLYVSSHTGEVVLDTDAQERFWNWLGSIPHWIYFTALRQHQPVWRQVIIWTSGAGIVGALTGLWIGVLRLRLRRRYPGRRVTPYRDWMKWHHVAGLIGGVFLITWIFSGYLSVNPNRWFAFAGLDDAALQRYAAHTTPNFPLDLTRLHAVRPEARQVRFVWLNGQPMLVLNDVHNAVTVRCPLTSESLQLARAALVDATQALLPQAHITLQELLTQGDSYWYSHHTRRPLPVLRVGFDDASATWVHLHPVSGQILGTLDRTDRAYRWWFDALHTMDYGLLLRHRPAWDIVVWTLSSLGLVTSVSGVIIGWRRLSR